MCIENYLELELCGGLYVVLRLDDFWVERVVFGGFGVLVGRFGGEVTVGRF